MNDTPKPRGGSRPGSGRKAEGNDRPSKVQLAPADLKLLDAHRGSDSRSAIVRRLIREWVSHLTEPPA